MSDDFDKEAEREKLREKYERDKAEREATQRMSDLLLKGATMTNMHCGTCGDPLFKQDGTTFCPSCHGNPDAVQGTDLEAQPAEESPADAAAGADEADADADVSTADSSAQPIDVESPSTADSESGAESTADTESSVATDEGAGNRESVADPSAGVQRSAGGNVETSPSQPQSRSQSGSPDRDDPQSAAAERRSAGDRTRGTRGNRRTAASPPVEGDLEAARESLVQALEKFAGEAAATDDPRYATECLEAAREAGEALSTLR